MIHYTFPPLQSLRSTESNIWIRKQRNAVTPQLMNIYYRVHISQGFPGGTSRKESTCRCRRHRDSGLISGSGRYPGEGHGNPLQYYCLENPMERRVWWAIVHRIAKSWTQLSDLAHTDILIKISKKVSEYTYYYKCQ